MRIYFLMFMIGLSTSTYSQNDAFWSFRFGWGPVFPDADQLVGANSPNGINISAGMSYCFNPRIYADIGLHFDYFTDDQRRDYKTHIIIFSPVAEFRLYALPARSRISPYLIGGFAPSLYVNTSPLEEQNGEFDPYSSSRNYDIQVGYSLKYGLGSNISLGEGFILWFEWRYNRFGFLNNRDPVLYRILMLGILMDVEWIF
ncbi:MAG: hypothetical protein JXL67_06535 [Calditrichaeota bacterium]|nr:hypothetical protein [Calditrichota bacterium]